MPEVLSFHNGRSDGKFYLSDEVAGRPIPAKFMCPYYLPVSTTFCLPTVNNSDRFFAGAKISTKRRKNPAPRQKLFKNEYSG